MKGSTPAPECVGLVLLACLVVILPVWLPLLSFPAVLFAPFPLAVLGVKYPWRYAVSVFGLQCTILVLLQGLSALLLVHYYGVVPLVMAWALRRGLSMSRTIVESVSAPLVLSVLSLAVYSLWTQQSPQVLLTEYFAPALQMLQEYAKTLEQAPQASPGQGEAVQAQLPQLFLVFLPALTAVNYLLTNVINYLVVRRYCQYGQEPTMLDPPDVALWRASDYLVWVFLASGAGLLFPSGFLQQFSLNVFVVTLVIYCLQGFAIALFWGRRLPLPTSVRWLAGVLLLLFAGPPCIVLCIVAGLFDQWVDFRRQRHKPVES